MQVPKSVRILGKTYTVEAGRQGRDETNPLSCRGILGLNHTVQQCMTVAEAHRSLREPMHIAPGAEPLVNGRETAADYVLEPNDRIEWVMRTGEKGIR